MTTTAKRSGNPAVRAAAQQGAAVDLDARRAAVREAKGEHLVIRFGGRDFHAGVEVPLTFAHALMQMDVPGAARCLFEDEDEVRDFLALNPTIEDFTAIMEGYGVDMGEASGSPGFSMSSGPLSSLTSNASTG